MAEEKELRQKTKDLLELSLDKMIKSYPDEMKRQLEAEPFLEKMDQAICVQGQGDNPVLGCFDFEINQYVTVDMLAVAIALADELNRVFQENPEHSSLSMGISIGIFIATLLNAIQPGNKVKLTEEDAEVYYSLLELQRKRPVNMIITREEFDACIRGIGREIDVSGCLDHLEEKRLLKVVPNGFIVKRDVKVEAV